MIDEEATFEQFGYRSTDLKPSSGKKIVAVCDDCCKIRYLHKNDYHNLCRPCAIKQSLQPPIPKILKEENRFVPNTGIDRILTIEKFGYDPIDLKPQSNRKIIKVCKICSEICETEFHQSNCLCRSCTSKHRLQPPSPKFVAEEDRYLNNTYIDRILTIEKFGYDPVDLSYGSSRTVITICKKCSEIREIVFKSYSDLCKLCGNREEEKLINFSCTVQNISRSEFKEFLTDKRYCNLFNEAFKTKIRNRFHNKCFICGKPKQEKDKNLAVHHVNYNKNCLCGMNCEFVPLCERCHPKTNWNRQYWENLIMGYLYPERYFMVDI